MTRKHKIPLPPSIHTHITYHTCIVYTLPTCFLFPSPPSYLSRVDLLRLLVSSRWTKIPSIQELTKPDLARRIRDRLIQDDRFRLAMEVSTKCQLDTSAVWGAWGMACLKCGDFTTARNKFKHCFQVREREGERESPAVFYRAPFSFISGELSVKDDEQ